ncbi:hypothetical protein [Cutibacterium namnetense]|uniref:hypothetical protein n=1 Tax=Cutibacterium namnetense TaxID=1574624 RepID=UPI0002F87550|nr:hypothetical protein [Cutibacterium namnetense]
MRLSAPADRLELLGICLDMLCQDITDALLVELAENGLHVSALFLDSVRGHFG